MTPPVVLEKDSGVRRSQARPAIVLASKLFLIDQASSEGS